MVTCIMCIVNGCGFKVIFENEKKLMLWRGERLRLPLDVTCMLYSSLFRGACCFTTSTCHTLPVFSLSHR